MHRLTGGRYALGLGRGFDLLFDVMGVPRVTGAQLEDVDRHLPHAVARQARSWATTGPPASYPYLSQDSSFDEDIPVLMMAIGRAHPRARRAGRRRRRAAHVLHRRDPRPGRRHGPHVGRARRAATRRPCGSGRCWPPSRSRSPRRSRCARPSAGWRPTSRATARCWSRANGWDPTTSRGSARTRSWPATRARSTRSARPSSSPPARRGAARRVARGRRPPARPSSARPASPTSSTPARTA